MKCMYCQGQMEKGTVPSYFEEQDVDSMQALVKAVENNMAWNKLSLEAAMH